MLQENDFHIVCHHLGLLLPEYVPASTRDDPRCAVRGKYHLAIVLVRMSLDFELCDQSLVNFY